MGSYIVLGISHQCKLLDVCELIFVSEQSLNNTCTLVTRRGDGPYDFVWADVQHRLLPDHLHYYILNCLPNCPFAKWSNRCNHAMVPHLGIWDLPYNFDFKQYYCVQKGSIQKCQYVSLISKCLK